MPEMLVERTDTTYLGDKVFNFPHPCIKGFYWRDMDRYVVVALRDGEFHSKVFSNAREMVEFAGMIGKAIDDDCKQH